MSGFSPAARNSRELIKCTMSRCPICHAQAQGEIIARNGQVFLHRTCEKHGPIENCISSDERFYFQSPATQATKTCCNTPPSPSNLDSNPTCIALIEIVNSCNLACPACFAASVPAQELEALPLETIQERIERIVEKKGSVEVLQLSGGEPTLHPRFFELLTWIQQHDAIGYTLVNTNGILLAQDELFASKLQESFVPGKLQLYLQFDGPLLPGQHFLRGADLRQTRQKAIDVAGRMGCAGLPVTLAMTVVPQNLAQVWDAVAFGLNDPHIRGITFQPFFASGRTPETEPGPLQHLWQVDAADIANNLIERAGGVLAPDDFEPLPCGDPNCAIVGYLLKTPVGPRSLRHYVDYGAAREKLKDRLNFDLNDLAQCGCSPTATALPAGNETAESHTFRLLIKPFMDAWNWDNQRLERCCTHVIRPDGNLDSFCRYYSGFPGTWNHEKDDQTTGGSPLV